MTSKEAREHPSSPLLGASCVVWNGNRVLLVKRGREPMKGRWSLPGGLVEVGEKLVEAARREVFEETSIHAEINGLVEIMEAITPSSDGGVARHFVVAVHTGRYLSGEPVPGDDAASVRWCTITDAKALDTTPRLLEFIERSRKFR